MPYRGMSRCDGSSIYHVAEILFPLTFASVYLEFAESSDGDLAVFPDVRVFLTGGPNLTFLLPSVFVENFQVARFRTIKQIAKFETMKRRVGCS